MTIDNKNSADGTDSRKTNPLSLLLPRYEEHIKKYDKDLRIMSTRELVGLNTLLTIDEELYYRYESMIYETMASRNIHINNFVFAVFGDTYEEYNRQPLLNRYIAMALVEQSISTNLLDSIESLLTPAVPKFADKLRTLSKENGDRMFKGQFNELLELCRKTATEAATKGKQSCLIDFVKERLEPQYIAEFMNILQNEDGVSVGFDGFNYIMKWS